MSRRLAVGLMAIIFLAFNVWAMYTFFTSKYPGANDFYQRWNGAYAFWQQHLNPYSKEVALQAEMFLYHDRASTDPALDQYPGDFLYPFHAVILLAPLTVMSYPLASAIWLVLTGASVALSFLLLADLFNWRRPIWLTTLGVAWAITFYPAARGLFLGQIGTVVVCLELMTIWALAKDRDILAGILLAISTVKPQIGFLIIPFLLLWALRMGRWRFLISFAVTFGLLMMASFILLSSWLGQWLAQASQYTGYTRIGSPVWVITNVYLPFLDGPGEVVIDALLVGLLLWTWWPLLRQPDSASFEWTAALTLTVTHLVAVRTATPHFVAFLIVLVFIFREITRAYRRYGPWLVAALMIGLSVGLWGLFLTTLYGTRFEHPINYLPLPLGALIFLWLTRRRWTTTRSASQMALKPNANVVS